MTLFQEGNTVSNNKLIFPVALKIVEDWLIDFWCFKINATFSNISAILWRPLLVVEEAEVPGENHQPWANNNSIDASFQVSAHLAKWFQRRRFFRTQPIRNKNCLWWPCLLMDRDEMNILYRGPYIDASFQVSVHLAKGFQWRRLKCEKFTDGRMTDAKWWQYLTLPLKLWFSAYGLYIVFFQLNFPLELHFHVMKSQGVTNSFNAYIHITWSPLLHVYIICILFKAFVHWTLYKAI